MNLPDLPIPDKFCDIIKTYEYYYHTFYLEMVRMSNANFTEYVDKYFILLYKLGKYPGTQNSIRAAIGVVCLHKFGYNNFRQLTLVFDRLIPQVNIEYIKFTSWCVGRLVHHPDPYESHYATQLFRRVMDWTRMKGRRARPLAAVYMLESLSYNAGSIAVSLLPSFQNTLWSIVSIPSIFIIKQTAKAIKSYTGAIIRYSRNNLNEHLTFIIHVCLKLLFFDDQIRQYASLLIFQVLFDSSPHSFVPYFNELINDICKVTKGNTSLILNCGTYLAMSSLSQVNPSTFVESFAEYHFQQTESLIYDFPIEITQSLIQMCSSIPEFIEKKLDQIKQFGTKLIDEEPDCSFRLLSTLLECFGAKVLPIGDETLIRFIQIPFSEDFNHFFTTLMSCNSTISADVQICLFKRIIKKLRSENKVITLNLISHIPKKLFIEHEHLLNTIWPLTVDIDVETRSATATAIFNIAKSTEDISIQSISKRILQLAIYEQVVQVRCQFLQALIDNAEESLASPEFRTFYEIFINDDSSTVRSLFYQLLYKLTPFNPMAIVPLIRRAMRDSLFVILNVPSIRKRAKTFRGLPILIKASGENIKLYSNTLMDIILNILKNHNSKQKFDNFLEEDAHTAILIAVVDSLALLAPMDPETVSKHSSVIIKLLCEILMTSEHRKLRLSILDLFYILLSAPASTLEFRIQIPQILSTCSDFLLTTPSRKCRMAILKVFGTIGIVEVHQRPKPKGTQAPKNIDNDLARQFFTPSRDSDNPIDDALLLNSSTVEEYLTSFVADSLMELLKDTKLKDFYYDIICACGNVLSHPKMYILNYFDVFVARLLEILEQSSDNEIVSLIPLYSQLISNSTHNTSPFLKRTLELIHKRYNDTTAQVFLDLIISFILAVRDGFSPYSSETISFLIITLDDKKTANAPLCIRVLKAFEIIGVYSADLLYLTIPQICDAILCEQTLSPVRIAALSTLQDLAAAVDILPYLGPIARTIEYCFINLTHQKILNSTFSLLYTIIKSQGKSFLNNAQPLLDFLRETDNYTPELRELIEKAENGKFGDTFHPLHSHNIFPPIQNIEPLKDRQFSTDIIISKAEDSQRAGSKSDRWLQSFILCVIRNSPSQAINACTALATSYYPFAKKLFNAAFFSCWRTMNKEPRVFITKVFEQLLNYSEDSEQLEEKESTARSLIELIVFMDKIEQPIGIPLPVLVESSRRCGYNAFALRLQNITHEENPKNLSNIMTLIDLLVKMGHWQNAIGVWRHSKNISPILSSSEVLSKLRMWDQVEPVYRSEYSSSKNFRSFKGLIESLASLAKWDQMMEFHDDFLNLELQQKQNLALFFADAAFHLNQWESLEEILHYASDDMWRVCVLQALVALHNKDFEKVDNVIQKCLSLLVSRPMTFWADNQQIPRETMLECQELIEVIEMKEWLTNPEKRAAIAEVWNQRLKTGTRNFDEWFAVLSNRVRIASIRDDALVQLFQMQGEITGQQIYLNAFNILYPDYKKNMLSHQDRITDEQRLCHALAEWNVGNEKSALDEVKKLTTTLSGNLLMKANHYYAQWLLKAEGETLENLKDAYQHLEATVNQIDESTIFRYGKKEEHLIHSSMNQNSKNLILPSQMLKSLYMHIKQINIIRKWGAVNASLITVDTENKTNYTINAITALSKCLTFSPSFPDIVQVLNIFFQHAGDEKIFNETSQFIKNLPVKLLLQASSQIMIQLSHKNPRVREFTNDLVFSLLEVHYHSMVFTLFVLKYSRNAARANAATTIINRLLSKQPEVIEEATLIRNALLRAAVTWHEKIVQKISDATAHYQQHNYNRVVNVLRSIVVMVSEPQCEMQRQFLKQYSNNIHFLNQILKMYRPSRLNQLKNTDESNPKTLSDRRSINCINQLMSWCENMEEVISEEVKRTKTIMLSTISKELNDKENFVLAVPGTYKPNSPVNHIKYFVGQFSVMQSKQSPKDVIIKGEDGVFYQYLLKGHEDLRLDERIMQFFRMINSLMVNDSLLNMYQIQTLNVIPLSISHGLVQWATGTYTLRAIIEQYRKHHSRDPLEEYLLTDEYGNANFDFLLPIQKVAILEKIFNEIPDTDLANFFWLKAPTADTWLRQIDTYSISVAINSIVGYIIGLGDRHPSNLLIDRNTGKAIHIDFGDCFERAAMRTFLPEIMPFRLTRMMVRALGPGGVDGIFRTSFVSMSTLLRANEQVLEMVLALFVHEPLIDPDAAEDNATSNQGSKEQKYTITSNLPRPLFPKITQQNSRRINDNDRVGSNLGISLNDTGDDYDYDYDDAESEKKSFESIESYRRVYLLTSTKEMRARIRQKLTGTDFGDGQPLSVEEQATVLIKNATDIYNLGKTYSGWCPFW